MLLRPVISEKSMRLAQDNLYTFEVERWVTKPQAAKQIAEKFGVKVLNVKIINIHGETKQQKVTRKRYMTKGFKKALIRVKKGDKIALFETPKEEVIPTSVGTEGEPIKVKEKKDLLGRTKVKVEQTGVGSAPTTQRKVITGK